MSEKATLFDDDRAGEIYRTAAQMIYEKGFGSTSMNEIAEAVQLTKPGLYYYVKGKKELLFSIMNFAMDRLDEEVVGPAREIADPQERLRWIVRQHARLLTEARDLDGAVLEALPLRSPLLPLLEQEPVATHHVDPPTFVRFRRAYLAVSEHDGVERTGMPSARLHPQRVRD